MHKFIEVKILRKTLEDVGADDQDIMFRYMGYEVGNIMPLMHTMSTRLTGVHKNRNIEWLRQMVGCRWRSSTFSVQTSLLIFSCVRRKITDPCVRHRGGGGGGADAGSWTPWCQATSRF